jgi:hypothetical protein
MRTSSQFYRKHKHPTLMFLMSFMATKRAKGTVKS